MPVASALRSSQLAAQAFWPFRVAVRAQKHQRLAFGSKAHDGRRRFSTQSSAVTDTLTDCARENSNLSERWTPPPNRALRWSSRKKLVKKHIELFEGNQPMDELARAICEAECVPRKELFEAIEVGIRIHEHFSSSSGHLKYPYIIDACSGHGLLAWVMLVLSCQSGNGFPLTTFCVDQTKRIHLLPRGACLPGLPSQPPSAWILEESLLAKWPHLRSRMRFVEGDLLNIRPNRDTLVISVHACGELSDALIKLTTGNQSALALMPCCHGTRKFQKRLIQIERENPKSAPAEAKGGARSFAESPFSALRHEELVAIMDDRRVGTLLEAGLHVKVNK
eukprot:738172-Prorocentrum_minimum.AAC.2